VLAGGDVYGYVIENANDDDLDSCWGFYGIDYCIQEAKDAAEHVRKNRDHELAALVCESAD
jgi:hypothetical protein